MGKKLTLNEKRLAKKQVKELIDGGAKPREDLMAALRAVSGMLAETLVYELSDDRILLVYDPDGFSLPGKGDIWALDDFLRFVRGCQQNREDGLSGRSSSVDHWAYYSAFKEHLPERLPQLLAELPDKLGIDLEVQNLSYASLDPISARINEIGKERAKVEVYDHLVAYVGEVMRLRVQGTWRVETRDGRQPYPYVLSAIGGKLMPVNVAWGELVDFQPADLRREAANEVRRGQWEGRIDQRLDECMSGGASQGQPGGSGLEHVSDGWAEVREDLGSENVGFAELDDGSDAS
jgi:hypothetical protein